MDRDLVAAMIQFVVDGPGVSVGLQSFRVRGNLMITPDKHEGLTQAGLDDVPARVTINVNAGFESGIQPAHLSGGTSAERVAEYADGLQIQSSGKFPRGIRLDSVFPIG